MSASETFFEQYITTALWSSLDDDGQPFDSTIDQNNIDNVALDELRSDCDKFVEANADDLADIDPGQAGHDFWLTRNHHGAGFWDRGLGDVGDRLTKAAHVYGEVNLYRGDDGKLYV